jgi:hypothetical protein
MIFFSKCKLNHNIVNRVINIHSRCWLDDLLKIFHLKMKSLTYPYLHQVAINPHVNEKWIFAKWNVLFNILRWLLWKKLLDYKAQLYEIFECIFPFTLLLLYSKKIFLQIFSNQTSLWWIFCFIATNLSIFCGSQQNYYSIVDGGLFF